MDEETGVDDIGMTVMTLSLPSSLRYLTATSIALWYVHGYIE